MYVFVLVDCQKHLEIAFTDSQAIMTSRILIHFCIKRNILIESERVVSAGADRFDKTAENPNRPSGHEIEIPCGYTNFESGTKHFF